MAFNPSNGDDTAFLVGPGTATVDFLGGIDTLDMGTEGRANYTIVQRNDGTIRINSISSASGGGLNLTVKNLEFISFNGGPGNPRDVIDLSTFFGATTPAPTAINGGTGNDLLSLSTGRFTVDGGAGIDTVALTQLRANYTVAATATGHTVNSADGNSSYSLTQVERVQFANSRLALDLNGNAGTTAKILGAVFGAASVKAQPDYVGIGLRYLDTGTSYENLMQLALDARLGPGATPAQVVTLLYTHVVGVAPPAADLAYYTGLLDSKAYTPATLGVLAADTSLNVANIDLMGLTQTGLPFVLA
jgi:hypothetical protein